MMKFEQRNRADGYLVPELKAVYPKESEFDIEGNWYLGLSGDQKAKQCLMASHLYGALKKRQNKTIQVTGYDTKFKLALNGKTGILTIDYYRGATLQAIIRCQVSVDLDRAINLISVETMIPQIGNSQGLITAVFSLLESAINSRKKRG